ncbi:MAG: hypothetical protein ACSHYB_13170 [Roseibacillus sp.]
MKTTLTVLFTSLIALASVAQGDTYRTLNGYQDSVQIPAGQTAFVVSATSRVVLGVESSGKRELQYRFADAQKSCRCESSYSTYRNRSQNLFPTPSVNSPVPIAGPAKLVLRSSGMLTISMPQTVRRASTSSSTSVRRFAKN